MQNFIHNFALAIVRERNHREKNHEKWITPKAVAESFHANNYISSCITEQKYYKIHCDVGTYGITSYTDASGKQHTFTNHPAHDIYTNELPDMTYLNYTGMNTPHLNGPDRARYSGYYWTSGGMDHAAVTYSEETTFITQNFS